LIALDTSALVAILAEEPEAERFKDAMARAEGLLIGVPTVLELRMLLTGRSGPERANAMIEAVLTDAVRVDFDRRHLAAAVSAFDRYGKGRHPASLNFGDCMAYAVAAVAGCPLLYKGEDFARTDIGSALVA
jgi:ribonuclease VapC